MSKSKKIVTPPYFSEDGLFQYRENGKLYCLGYLLYLKGAIFEPTYGKLDDVSEDMANKHNSILDDMLIRGLDKCEVNQGNNFYLTGQPGAEQITTFTGKVVGDVKRVNGIARIVRQDKWFECRLPKKGSELVFLKRVR